MKIQTAREWLVARDILHLKDNAFRCEECDRSGIGQDDVINVVFQHTSSLFLCTTCLATLHSLTSPLSVLVTLGIDTSAYPKS